MSPRGGQQAMAVMVTGAEAPVGERLVRELLDDSRVGVVVAVSHRDPGALPFRASDRLQLHRVDLSHTRRLHDLLFGAVRALGVRVVVHTAMHGSAWGEGRAMHRQNVDGSRLLLSLCERHPTIERLVVRSAAEVYQVQRDLPVLIGEDHPLNLSAAAPQWVRDRVEADLTVCTRMGLSEVSIAVLRMAEVLAAGTGSQLHDYLSSRLCLRPAGFDPMVNVMTIDDAAVALQKAVHSDAIGVFNVPGVDTLPLSTCIAAWGRTGVPVPEMWMNPAYRWRWRIRGNEFRYGMNRRRFHYSGVLDGSRARAVLGFVPSHPVAWPNPTGV